MGNTIHFCLGSWVHGSGLHIHRTEFQRRTCSRLFVWLAGKLIERLICCFLQYPHTQRAFWLLESDLSALLCKSAHWYESYFSKQRQITDAALAVKNLSLVKEPCSFFYARSVGWMSICIRRLLIFPREIEHFWVRWVIFNFVDMRKTMCFPIFFFIVIFRDKIKIEIKNFCFMQCWGKQRAHILRWC